MPKLVIGIMSGQEQQYADRRSAVSLTWKPATNNSYFFVGGAKSFDLVDDIVHLPVADDYYSLSLKIVAFIRWLLNSIEFDYLFKCDDDTYVVPDRLYSVVLNHDYIGQRIFDNQFPYASGGAGYFLSRRACELVAMSKLEPVFCEDLIIAKSLANYGIVVQNDQRFRGDRINQPNLKNDMITAHTFRTKQLMLDAHAAYLKS